MPVAASFDFSNSPIPISTPNDNSICACESCSTAISTPSSTLPSPTVHACDKTKPSPPKWRLPAITIDTRHLPPLPKIRDPGLCQLARRHKSRAVIPFTSIRGHEGRQAAREAEKDSYHRLELLGDAVVEHRTIKELYARFPAASSGTLTTLKIKLVKNDTLSYLSWAYGLSETLECNNSSGSLPLDQKILADLLEAHLGALDLEGDRDSTTRQELDAWIHAFVSPLVFPFLDLEVESLVNSSLSRLSRRGANKKRKNADLDGKLDSKRPRFNDFACVQSDCRDHASQADRISWSFYQHDGEWHNLLSIGSRKVACGRGQSQVLSRQAALTTAFLLSLEEV